MRWTRRLRNITKELAESRGLDNNAPYIKAIDTVAFKIRTELSCQIHPGPSVFGDYDVDGICASVIFASQVNCKEVILPDRFKEGYGLSMAMAERLAKSGDVVLLDCGTSSTEEIKLMRDSMVRVVVVDHHPSPKLDQTSQIASSFCNPVQYGMENGPCTAGLVYIGTLNEEKPKFAHLAALATLADQCDMSVYYNRKIVRDAMATKVSNVGLKALMDACGVEDFDERACSFKLAPCINAAGRMGDPRIAFDLLMEPNYKKAQEMANQLVLINNDRKVMKERMFNHALNCNTLSHSVVIGQPKYHIGVVGIVASMMMEHTGKTSVIMGEKDGNLVGSCRAPSGINVTDALKECEHLLIRFGGHAGAAGLQMKPENLSLFKTLFNQAVSRQQSNSEHVKHFDMGVNLMDLTVEEIKNVNATVGPFGRNNEQPVYEVVVWQKPGSRQRQTADKKHCFLDVTDGTATMSLKCFNYSSFPQGVVQCRVNADIDKWVPRGQAREEKPTMTLLDYTKIVP